MRGGEWGEWGEGCGWSSILISQGPEAPLVSSRAAGSSCSSAGHGTWTRSRRFPGRFAAKERCFLIQMAREAIIVLDCILDLKVIIAHSIIKSKAACCPGFPTQRRRPIEWAEAIRPLLANAATWRVPDVVDPTRAVSKGGQVASPRPVHTVLSLRRRAMSAAVSIGPGGPSGGARTVGPWAPSF